MCSSDLTRASTLVPAASLLSLDVSPPHTIIAHEVSTDEIDAVFDDCPLPIVIEKVWMLWISPDDVDIWGTETLLGISITFSFFS